MSLGVSIGHQLAGFSLEATFDTSGRLTALFGPSGCGKTTIVNVIAGLVKPQRCRVVFDGQVLADTAQNIWLPAHKRQIGYVFQDARLLPHLSVRQNLRYGQWFTPKHQRYAAESDIIDLLGLSQLLDSNTKQLSGGERQRVAIGRALLQSPRLLLMDEPLASLDDARKLEIIPYIERLRDETRVPIVYVSHAIAEVTRLATDVVLMRRGSVVECGAVQRVLPNLSFVNEDWARDAGTVIDAQIGTYDAEADLTTLMSDAGPLRVAGAVNLPDKHLRLHVRSGDITLATSRPANLSAINILEGVVATVSSGEGASVTICLRCGQADLSARITRYSAKTLGIVPGMQVFAIIKAVSFRPGQ